MAKQTSTGTIAFGIGNERTVVIERNTFNMGKRREVFYIELQNKATNSVFRLPNLTLEELEKIIESAKELKETMESEN